MESKQTALATYHPFLCLIYYTIVLVTTMFTTNPLVRLISLSGALFACLITLKKEQMKQNIRLGVFIGIVSAVSNFLFVHSGATVFFEWQFTLFGSLHRYVFTFESLIYGLSFGMMMTAILLWFQSLSVVLTSDKIVFIFGRWLPKIALVLSMVMRFIPMFQRQTTRIQAAQKGVGMKNTTQFSGKIANGTTTFNALFSWALENAVETSDSMNARGFGLTERTNFTVYAFRRRDLTFGSLLLLLTIGTFLAFKEDLFKFYFYPRLRMVETTPTILVSYVIVSLLMLIPVLVEAKERIKWHYLISKI